MTGFDLCARPGVEGSLELFGRVQQSPQVVDSVAGHQSAVLLRSDSAIFPVLGYPLGAIDDAAAASSALNTHTGREGLPVTRTRSIPGVESRSKSGPSAPAALTANKHGYQHHEANASTTSDMDYLYAATYAEAMVTELLALVGIDPTLESC